MNEEDYYKRYHGVCHCSSCQSRSLEYSDGLELPARPADTHYAKWLSFSRGVIDELTARVRAFIAERLPDACLILGKSADIMFHEANKAIGRELWHHATSDAVSAWISYRPDVPVLVNSTCFMDMPYRMASEEPAHFAQYLLQCISRGEITQFHKKWKGVYDGLQPCSKTGLVRPDRAQMTAPEFEEALNTWQQWQRTGGPGGRYEVIVLPNLGNLSAEDVDALDDWVLGGGRLIATGSSGVGEGGVVQLKSLPSRREHAVVSKRELLWSSYFAPQQIRSDAHVYTGPIVPLYGVYHLFEWKSGTGGRYNMLARAPFSPPEKAYGNAQVEQRGCGVGHFGSGKGIVIPFTVGRGYRELGLAVFRDFYATILRDEGDAKEQLSCSIAEQVEMTVNTNGSQTVVHLINMSGARKQNFGSHLPVSGGTIRVLDSSNITARTLLRDKPLEVRHGEISLPELDLFEVVVITRI
ncbi:hypothetical protein NKR23_g5271 [Pleurostoma richardsiae]|uniref:Beta-galactosidase trimerisation domain-containing protein n=1 Tax=Pleurostoma richardsiae TaxID=41990 RepID=A0AA38RGT7_9PEZI|nr:hypothetical protein NKR23_g5271 [Pleurostoma richardsiae]